MVYFLLWGNASYITTNTYVVHYITALRTPNTGSHDVAAYVYSHECLVADFGT